MEESKVRQEKRLVTARDLERFGISSRTAYKLALKGSIPCYRVGLKKTGVRFVAEEVLEALRHRS